MHSFEQPICVSGGHEKKGIGGYEKASISDMICKTSSPDCTTVSPFRKPPMIFAFTKRDNFFYIVIPN